MKSSLVFALFGVFLASKNVEAEKCVPPPAFLTRNVQHCFASLDKADQELLLEGGELERKNKCFEWCLLEEIGYFKNGQLHVEKIEEFARNYMPTEELAEDLIATIEDSILKAMARGGDNCDIAHEYFKIKEEKKREDPSRPNVFCRNKADEEGNKDEGEKGG